MTLRDEVKAWAMKHNIRTTHALEAWSERAAIREYDGGQGRAVAETNALDYDLPPLFGVKVKR